MTFHMNAFAIGETKRIRLKVHAAQYSLGAADHPDVRFWVKNVDGVYSKADFDSKPVNPSGQEWNGGDLRAWTQVDVFAKTKWTFDGGTLEGWSGVNNTTALVDETAKAAVITTTGDDPQFIGPETSFDAATFPTIRIRGKSTLQGAAKVYFATADAKEFDESRSLEFPGLTADMKDVVVDLSKHPAWKGTITRLRIDPATSGSGTVTLEDLRMAGPGGTPTEPTPPTPENPATDSSDVEGGCGCRLAPTTQSSGLAVLALAGLAALRRRRRG
jgi:MYXO-CTERM domain-containing protein